jgi:dolichol-phosphate mannosyltransferase
MGATPPGEPSLCCFSIVIPARDEEAAIGTTVQHLHRELTHHSVPHEIVVVDDGSSDGTWSALVRMEQSVPGVRAIKNEGPHGFGRAVIRGIEAAQGDAIAIVMADESDDCGDVVRYWNKLREGYDAVFGSRFMAGGGTIDYPFPKYVLNRAFNWFIQILFGLRLNDTTNAFKGYRMTTLQGLRPFLAPHFNLTVELPLKTIVRGYSWAVIPITWRNRRTGIAKLKIKEMGARYMFIVLYVWREKYFSRGDFRKATER